MINDKSNYYKYLESPIGLLELYADCTHLLEVKFVENKPYKEEKDFPILQQAQLELNEYFAGKRFDFSIPLRRNSTPFQLAVWNKLVAIPYAKTISYQQLAFEIGKPKACRAVGNANGLNKIPIIIPCHRVIGKNGSVGGYSAGVWRKEWLLKHEQKHKLVISD